MNGISVSLGATGVALSGGRAAVTASVTNGLGVAERVVVGVYAVRSAQAASSAPDIDPASWASIERPLREIGPGATEQYVVALEAPGVPAGTYELKVIAYPADLAPEEYSDKGQSFLLEVPPAPVPAPRRRPWWLFALVGALVIAIAAVAFLLLRSPKLVEVPDLAGLTQLEARNRLAEDGFTGTLLTATVDEPGVAKDVAVRSEPAAGKSVQPDVEVTIVLATGFVEVPDLEGTPDTDAESALDALQLGATFSGSRPGTVTAQDRIGLVPVDATVALTIDPDEPVEPPCTPWPLCILPDRPILELPLEPIPIDPDLVSPGL